MAKYQKNLNLASKYTKIRIRSQKRSKSVVLYSIKVVS